MGGSSGVKVAIDASGSAGGGGVTYLEEMLPRLAELPSIRVMSILARRSLQTCAALGDLHVIEAESRWSALNPHWKWEVEHNGSQVVFVPTEISPRRYRVPLVCMLRNAKAIRRARFALESERISRDALRSLLAARASGWTDHFVAVSEYAKGLAMDTWAVPSSRISVIYHGGPIPAFNDSSLMKVPGRLLFVSHISKHKGLEFLLQALSGLGGEWCLCVAGQFTSRRYESRLINLANEFELGDRVSFVGSVERRELPSLYASSSCLVWPSESETFGHPLIEATRYGLPVIAARSASNPEILGPGGYYYAPGDIWGLRALLKRAVTDELKPAILPRSYDWDVAAEMTADLLVGLARRAE
jgi:glycosyltransferase involved in cell wall biosynthesis